MTDAEAATALTRYRDSRVWVGVENYHHVVNALDAAIARLSATCEMCQWWDKRHGFNTSECGRGLYKHMGPNDSCSKHTPRQETR